MFPLHRDTGYRAVPGHIDKEKQFDEACLDTLPHCPAFKGKIYAFATSIRVLKIFFSMFLIEIGEKIGPFDLSFIPIGAYSPRWFMSTVHCSPEDAVRVHEDVRSKKSVSYQRQPQRRTVYSIATLLYRLVFIGAPLC